MKNQYLHLVSLVLMFVFSSCEDDNSTEVVLSCEPTTGYFGSFILNYFSGNPVPSGFRNPNRQEAVCLEDIYPVQIAGTGTGNCGLGYEMNENPFLGPAISLQEYDISNPEFSVFKRYLNVMGIFSCHDFSTRESFFYLFQPGQYGFASDNEDFGNFIIEFWEDGELYSSRSVAQTGSAVIITEVEYFPDFGEGSDSVEATLIFDAVLQGLNGKHIQVKDAIVKGRFYRSSPWGYEWED
ncbi:hypothetical protein [Shivajiella indica]|uniref:Lipoprotein n=1 Tax=Shivajiella indica TaxID=872115 RepID=A0ABW5BC47_9BACT